MSSVFDGNNGDDGDNVVTGQFTELLVFILSISLFLLEAEICIFVLFPWFG